MAGEASSAIEGCFRVTSAEPPFVVTVGQSTESDGISHIYRYLSFNMRRMVQAAPALIVTTCYV